MIRVTAGLAFLLTALSIPAAAQVPTGAAEGLELFVRGIAEIWAAEDASALIERSPAGVPIRLDTGSGTEPSEDRHAAAALRELFSERESISARAVQVTLAGSDPLTGFGRIAWTFRDRGAPAEQTRDVYVAVVREPDGWKLSELRLMP